MHVAGNVCCCLSDVSPLLARLVGCRAIGAHFIHCVTVCRCRVLLIDRASAVADQFSKAASLEGPGRRRRLKSSEHCRFVLDSGLYESTRSLDGDSRDL